MHLVVTDFYRCFMPQGQLYLLVSLLSCLASPGSTICNGFLSSGCQPPLWQSRVAFSHDKFDYT